MAALCSCLFFDIAYIALSIGMWLLAAAFTGMAITRWRVMCEVDVPILALLLLSWCPTVAWVIGCALNANLFGVESNDADKTLLLIIFGLLVATSLQIFLIARYVWRDLLIMYPVVHFTEKTRSSSMKKIVRRQETKECPEDTDLETRFESKKVKWVTASTAWDSGETDSLAVVQEVKDDPRWVAGADDSSNSESSSDDEEIGSMSRKVEILGNSAADGRVVSIADKKDNRAESYHSVTCCCPTLPGSSLYLIFMSPFSLSADRPGFPTFIIIVLSAIVSIMMLVAGSVLWAYGKDYAIYGLGLVVFYLFFASYVYLRLGLLVIKSSIGHSRLGAIKSLFPAFLIVLGLVALIYVYPEYIFWDISFAWFCCVAVALHKGLMEDIYGDLKIPAMPYYFPVYKLSGGVVREDSLNSAFILVFLFMTGLWALWASQMVEPNEFGILLYILCCVAGAVYLKFTSGGLLMSSLLDEVTPEISHIAIDRSIRSVFRLTSNQSTMQSIQNEDMSNDAGGSVSHIESEGTLQCSRSSSPRALIKSSTQKARNKRPSILYAPEIGSNIEDKFSDLGGVGKSGDSRADMALPIPSAFVEKENESSRTLTSRVVGGESAAQGAALDDTGLPGSDKSTRVISVSRQRKNIDYVESLIDERDAAAEYLDNVVLKRCRGALSSWPIMNLIWGIMDGTLSNAAGFNRLYRESLIVLHAHTNLLNLTSSLSRLEAMIRLRALAMAQEEKRAREAELVAFLQETQPSMSHLTVAELSHMPPTLMMSLTGAFITYKQSSKHLQELEEKKALATERVLAAKLEKATTRGRICSNLTRRGSSKETRSRSSAEASQRDGGPRASSRSTA